MDADLVAGDKKGKRRGYTCGGMECATCKVFGHRLIRLNIVPPAACMEEGLVVKQERDERLIRWRELVEEMKKLADHYSFLLVKTLQFSHSCAKTRSPVSLLEVFHGIKRFFSFAILSAVMICLEWWSYELLVLLSGLLPNPELETSVLALCLNIISTLYAIPFGFAAGVSTRVSNELGAGNPKGARVAVQAIMILTIVETTIASTIVFASRGFVGYIFTNEKEVVDYVIEMVPFLCLNIIMDSIQEILSGVARSVGWQHLGAYMNFAAFYLVGIPVAVLLGFRTSLRGEGLWIGILVGAFVQVILLSVVTICTSYEKQATKAKERLFEGECSTESHI
ncbi:hypothetical protein L1987_66751 [Smallanthus sonchifolius]|uniref:Uncharacterized protein n=1 Tax=Smallanthus sonchifolius TaxID=185202 RepID=A0ACB9BY57_9ASTR|nr:hypothetical protein L1987_66751 [Smallanthus sonchifolius]